VLAACSGNDTPVPFRVASVPELGGLEGLPPVDWSNITKDPRLVDLEAFETHADTCKCDACWRAVVRMSNHPELASSGAS